MKSTPTLRPLLLVGALALALPAPAPHNLTVVNFGGANGAAQKKAYFEAYEKASGGKITPVEYNGEQARIKAMVEAKKVTWDVDEVEGPDISRGCDEGLFERTRGGGEVEHLHALRDEGREQRRGRGPACAQRNGLTPPPRLRTRGSRCDDRIGHSLFRLRSHLRLPRP